MLDEHSWLMSIFELVFAVLSVSGLSGLPEDLIKETEDAWSKVLAIVNNVHPSDSRRSQFFPLFKENVTGAQSFQGENVSPNFKAGLAFCLLARLIKITKKNRNKLEINEK